MISYEPEIAKSDRAKCWKCGRKIGIGTPEVSVITSMSKGWHRFYCFNCADLELQEEIAQQKDDINILKKRRNKLKKMIENSSKAIMLMGLDDGNKLK